MRELPHPCPCPPPLFPLPLPPGARNEDSAPGLCHCAIRWCGICKIWLAETNQVIVHRAVAAVLCRAFANTLLENKSKLDALGVKLVGIVKVQDPSAPVD